MFLGMQEVPHLHKNYSSGAIIWGSFHPIEGNILLLNIIGMYNYTAVVKDILFLSKVMIKFCNLSILNLVPGQNPQLWQIQKIYYNISLDIFVK